MNVISKDSQFDDCVILAQDAFDPDAVFLDDIVDDGVLPYLSLAVDGFTDDARVKDALELRPEDAAANEADTAPAVIPDVGLDPDQLEVYGWESSFFRKIKGYIGL